MSVQGLAAYGVLGEQQLLGQRCDQLAAHELSQSAPAAEASTGLAGAGASAGAASSNYDFVKIKVRLGTHLEHYYILSRFLLSRMLTVITLPQHKAVRVALDVKKQLVDQGRLDITQEELEEVLFELLRRRGYGDDYVRRYQMVTAFFQQKRPLIILVAGSACTGKSSLAQQLASRLNLPNVLQTDVLYELLRASGMGDLPAEPLWRRPLPAGLGAVAAFQRECATIRQALDGELCKCIRDGKSIIIEGLHLDPGLFLSEFGDPRGEGPPSAAPHWRAGGAGGPAAMGAEQVAEAPASVEQRLADLQISANSRSAPRLPALAEEGTVPNGSAAAAAPAESAGTATSQAGGLPHLQEQQRPQQDGPGPAAGPAEAAAGVRRTASFGDAVPRLSYGGLHRQQSPWKEAGSSKPMLRPRSARMSDQLGQRGQAVFMLQSTDGGEVPSAAGSLAGAPSLPPPVPSPRLSACISLPTVREHSPERQRQHGQDSSSSWSGALPAPAQQPAAAGAASQAGVPPLQLDCSEQHWLEQQQQQLEQASVGSQSAPAVSPDAPGIPCGQQEGASAPLPPQAPAAEALPGRSAQHSSVAAADAAAAAAAGTGPVFVPICLAVPDGEYEGMLQGWVEQQERAHASGAAAFGSGSGGGSNGGVGSSVGIGIQESAVAGDSNQNGSLCPAATSNVPASEAVTRLCAVQAHLRQYAASGVPVVELNVRDMGAALDAMHAYVLQCIALATGEVDYQ